MKRAFAVAMALALMAGAAESAYAQPGRVDDRHDNGRRGGPQNYQQQRHDWRKGGRIESSDWQRGRHVDYRARHLARPRRGYEWREVDGNYVMAAVAGGIIASIITGR